MIRHAVLCKAGCTKAYLDLTNNDKRRSLPAFASKIKAVRTCTVVMSVADAIYTSSDRRVLGLVSEVWKTLLGDEAGVGVAV